MKQGWFELMERSFPLFLEGASRTLLLLFFSGVLSFSLGLVFGIFTSQRFRLLVLSPLIEGVCFVARGVPFFVQLLILYFVLPDLLGLNLDPFVAAILALGICSSGYVAQFVRGTLNVIPLGQWEAAFSLGYGRGKTLLHIISPQLLRLILPMLNNELESLLKSTAIASSIGLLEITRVGMNLVSREMEPIPIYLTLAAFYLCFSLLLRTLNQWLEKRWAYVKY